VELAKGLVHATCKVEPGQPLVIKDVPFALLCGQMAGKYIAKAIHENDFAILKEYEEDCSDTFGDSLMHAVPKEKS
jgi:flavin-dependent dehydrogenase